MIIWPGKCINSLVWRYSLYLLSELIWYFWYCDVLGDYLWLHNNSFHIKSTVSCSPCMLVTCMNFHTLADILCMHACTNCAIWLLILWLTVMTWWCDGVYVRKQIGYIKVHSCLDWSANMILDNLVKPYTVLYLCILAMQRQTERH